MNVQMELVPLSQLKKGECAVIEEICGSAEECARLSAMGFCCGSFVRVLTPGSPCALVVGDTRVVLRSEQTTAIQVCPV